MLKNLFYTRYCDWQWRQNRIGKADSKQVANKYIIYTLRGYSGTEQRGLMEDYGNEGADFRFDEQEGYLEKDTYTLRPEGRDALAPRRARRKKQHVQRHWGGKEGGLTTDQGGSRELSVAQESMEESSRRQGEKWPYCTPLWPYCAWPYHPWQSTGTLF